MSLIFSRKEGDRRFIAQSGVLCGSKIEPLILCFDDEDESEKIYGTVDEIYDISIDEARSYLGLSRHQQSDKGFDFVSKLWIKRAVHAGLLHAAFGNIHCTDDYFFSLQELDKLRKNMKLYHKDASEYNFVDPLNEDDVHEFKQRFDDDSQLVRSIRDNPDYDCQFFDFVFNK